MSAPRFFRTAAAFCNWLERHHDRASELVVGFHRISSGKPSLSWPDAVDEALCYGWIDGVRHSLNETSYTIRFSPRRTGSVWSNVNIAKADTLIRDGRMRPAGLAAFARRDAAKSGIYSFERAITRLDPEAERTFKRNSAAWTFFQAQPPYYRRVAIFYVINAKQSATRERRLRGLIEHSAKSKRLPQFANPAKRP